MRPNVGKNIVFTGTRIRFHFFRQNRIRTGGPRPCHEPPTPQFTVKPKMLCKVTTAAVKRLRLSSTRALSTRPEPQQTDSLLQIGSRRIYDSTHDGK
jgi:hypothetical protein